MPQFQMAPNLAKNNTFKKPHCKPVCRNGLIIGWKEYRIGIMGALSFVRYHWV
jgi:hypothetical protein